VRRRRDTEVSDEGVKLLVATGLGLFFWLATAIVATLPWWLDLLIGMGIGFVLVYGGTLIIIVFDGD
jgi:hypothetical protein